MTTDSPQLLIPAAGYLQNVLPSGLIDLSAVADALDAVWMEPPAIETDPVLSMKAAFLIENAELVVGIPGLDAVALVLGSSGQGTWFRFGFELGAHPVISLTDMPITLRLKNDLLRPAREVPGGAAGAPKQYEVDPTRDHLDIVLAEVGVAIDLDGGISFTLSSSIDLPPCMIGDSGVVIEARDIQFHLDAGQPPPPGQPQGWKGVHLAQATLSLPGELAGTVGTLQLTDAYIGNGGFTGTVSDTWTPALSASVFGMDLTLASAQISFVQNAPTQCALHGTLMLPFFDQPLGVDLSIGLNGDISVAVSATQPAGVTGAGGLLTFSKPGVLEAEVDSLGFALTGGTFSVTLSGSVRPLVPGVDWPKFAIKALTIDAHGDVKIDGGWLDLPSQYSISFFGFRIDITRLGFGQNPDGGRWVGFSGGVTLVSGMTAGASVDGLRVTWQPDNSVKLTLDGIAVALEIPDTLRFTGSVAYHEIGGVHRFDGAVTIELLALDLRLDGQIVIGTDTAADGSSYTFFALYLGIELPAGIPLWSTGLGLYGIDGLIAIDMAPNKGAAPNVLHPASRADEEWYENTDGSPGWYKRAPIGISDLRSKWDPLDGAFALGGGVTIGTIADNGYTFAGKVLLVVSLPGPVILIEGKANLLKERATLTDDPIFRALVVLDFRAGTFLVGLDAKYKVGDGGEILDIGASAEFYFSLADPSTWHLYVGVKDPKERRIRAHLLSIFEANSYFMIDAKQLQMGAWVGYDAHWSFGPLAVVIEAWLDGGVDVSWKPVHFHGEIWLHGAVSLKVFGFGLGLHVDAKFGIDVFDPFHILAEFSVGISLPWPLPDFGVDITLEWGPEPTLPPLPLPLKEIAVEHFKGTVSWPLARGELLLPNLDAGNGVAVLPATAADLGAPAPAGAPVVPVDSRPHLTFGRPVHDDALVGVNPQPVLPAAVPAGWERIGDPAANEGPMRVRYSVQEVLVERWNGVGWDAVARKGTTANPAGVRDLFGSWAPIPALPSGTVAPGTDPPIDQTKLWLWSRTPFDYTRHGGSAWDEWFTDTYTGYPCVPPPRVTSFCVGFDDRRIGQTLPQPVTFTGHPQLTVTGPESPAIAALILPVAGHDRALTWPAARLPLSVTLVGGPASEMRLWFAPVSDDERHCASWDAMKADSSLGLPDTQDGIVLSLAGQPTGRIGTISAITGLMLTGVANVRLPCPAGDVDITVAQFSSFIQVTGLDATGATVATAAGSVQAAVETVRLSGAGIVTVRIAAPNLEAVLLRICADCRSADHGSGQVIGIDDGGTVHGPYLPAGGVVTVAVPQLRRVVVEGRPGALAQICVTIPADGATTTEVSDMTAHLVDAMGRFAEEGAVLLPDTTYRLRVSTRLEAVGEGALSGVDNTYDLTELAYFRTEGPPGLTTLSLPAGQDATTFRSGLDDLGRYVAHTVPASGGQQLQPTRPVLRAYDVGVVFNEDYVDLMYRQSRRDLAIYLYDANNRPVRDPLGRVIVSANRWGHTDTVTVSDSERRYLTTLSGVDCVSVDQKVIPHHVTLFAGDDGQVLSPDTVYEARLSPLLLHEDFTAGLGAWTVVDSGDQETPSAWATVGHPTISGTGASAAGAVVTVADAGDLSALDPSVDAVVLATDTARPDKSYRIVSVDNATKAITLDGSPALSGGVSSWQVPGFGRLQQTSNIWGGSVDGDDPVKPGTVLVTGDPGWSDYRFEVQLRSGDDDAIGVVFRWAGAGDHYRFSMDAERGYRRLVRIAGGVHTVLGEDDVTYLRGQDYLITVEALGADLGVYVDGDPVFRVRDAVLAAGRVGMYCWADQDARFTDVRVDDLSAAVPVPYRFSFTTSNYATFAHLVASTDGRTWPLSGDPGAVDAALAAALPPGSAPAAPEQVSYAALATAVLGAAAGQQPQKVETSLVGTAGTARALMVRSPEPVDWQRTALTVSHADSAPAPGDPPRDLAITAVATGGSTADDESVTLLLAETGPVAGDVLQRYELPGGLAATDEQLLFTDGFAGAARGVLLDEHFGPGALGRFTLVDSGDQQAPSAWALTAGQLHQTSNIWGGTVDGADPDKPGTVAITGGVWSDVTVAVTVRSVDDDAVGVVARWSGPADHYLFSMDAERSYRRLVRRAGGVVTTLWQDAVPYVAGQSYRMELTVFQDTLVGTIDDEPLFVVHDTAHAAGQVGLYCWADQDVYFSELRVSAAEVPPAPWTPAFATLDDLAVLDETGEGGPSAWSVTGGVLLQTASIGSTAASVAQPGTAALSRPSFAECRAEIQVSAGEGALGLLFGYRDTGNWLRLQADHTAGTRSLVRSVAGVPTVLWQDPAASFVPGTAIVLAAEVAGGRLRCWFDGVAVVDVVSDPALDAGGRTGAWCWRAPALQVDRLLVVDRAVRVGSWVVRDEPGVAGGASAWSITGGMLLQRSATGSATVPQAPGTVAVASLSTPPDALRDYRVGVTVSAHDGAVGQQFRRADAANFYRLSVAPGYRRLVSVVAGVTTTLWEDAGGYQPDHAVTLTVDAVGDRLVGYFGTTQLFDLTDGAHPAGGFALYTCGASRVRFSGPKLSSPPLAATALWRDSFATGDMTAWTVVDESTGGGPAAWSVTAGELVQTSNAFTSPIDALSVEKRGTQAVTGDAAWRDIVLSVRLRSDDDDALGVMFRYQDAGNYYRFSMDAERTYRRLVRNVAGTMTVLWSDAVVYQIGQEYELVVAAVGARLRGWLDGVPLFDVDDPALPAGRIGVYCWADQGARFRSVAVHPGSMAFDDWLFTDDLTGLDTARWTFLDDPAATEGPSVWSFTGGELRQTSTITAGDDGDSALPGTVALAGDVAWSDYRYTVALASDTGQAVGAVFRYTDPDNWYRLAVDPSVPYRRLTVCTAGVVTQLWSDAGALPAGRLALVTIDGVGDTLVGYLDGVQLFAVRDGAHPAGRIGLYCRADAGARFGSAAVSAARWATHYRFAADEQPLGAGTQLVIHSGNAAGWTADPRPGVRDRFVAGAGDPGTRLLPADRAVWLRVLGSDGKPGHRRRFLPAADFTPVAGAAVLRAADGTGLAVGVPGSALPSGTYRLTLTYRRDNTGADPGSDVLSRAGDTGDEVAVLDVDS